ncbi:MAG: integrase family protein [Dinoroseobacter sp.]|nr:integrase family protein [Dinoroseobacter sp.]
MPKQKLTDGWIKSKSVDKTTWYSDTDAKGLQLCVTANGVKTWYVNKWDPTAQKTRRVKLGPFADKKYHTRWARTQAGSKAADIVAGDVKTKAEQELSGDLPTFGDAFEMLITHRTSQRASRREPMTEKTALDYRNSFKNHLAQWGHIPCDQLPFKQMNVYLNTLQSTKPHAAHQASVCVGVTLKHVNALYMEMLPIPKLIESTKMRSRVETGKLDMSVSLADRLPEIMCIQNDVIRTFWMLTLYTGFRGVGFRSLTWDEIDMDEGVIDFTKLKKQSKGRKIALGDDARRLIASLDQSTEHVFPSRVKEVGHIDHPDRLAKTSIGDLRHYWMTAAREVAPLHVHRWLGQQSLTASDLRMLGHYGEPTVEEQRRAANAIAARLNTEMGTGSQRVIELHRTSA